MAGTDIAAALDEIRQRAEAATRGPWEAEDDEDCWRLFGNAGFSGRHPLQLLKAPKHGTPYAEYVPGPADADFIVAARSDIPRLLAAVQTALDAAAGWAGNQGVSLAGEARRDCGRQLRDRLEGALLSADDDA
jgi:hypothetical protein